MHIESTLPVNTRNQCLQHTHTSHSYIIDIILLLIHSSTITDIETNRSFLHTLHNQPVVDAKIKFCTLELHHPISHQLKVCSLGRSISHLAGHCWVLNTYKAYISTGISDVKRLKHVCTLILFMRPDSVPDLGAI